MVMIASNAPPDAMIVRPCFRMILDLYDSSERGTAIRFRSSSLSCSRSISRSLSAFSSTPRNAKEIYQSQMTRRKIREKKSIHSSSWGMPLLASRGGGVGMDFWRSRGSSIKSPVSSKSGGAGSASTSPSPTSRGGPSKPVASICSSIPSASAASGVSPWFGGRILPVSANANLFRFCTGLGCWLG